MNNKNVLVKAFALMTRTEIKYFVLILILSVIAAFAQSVGIASFLPFMNLLLDINVIHTNKYLSWVYNYFNFKSDNQFVIAIGITVGTLIVISTILTVANLLLKNRFILFYVHRLSHRLMSFFLNRPYEFMLNRNSSDLIRLAINDASDFSNNFLNAFIDILINTSMLLSIFILLLLVNVKVTLIIVGVFFFIYASLTIFSRVKLAKNGKKVLSAMSDRQKYAFEAFNGFKTAKAHGLEEYFIERFDKYSKKVAKAQLFSHAIFTIPRNMIEASIFFGFAIGIVIMIIRGININVLIPTLSVYVVAGYKIMPEIGKVFSSISIILHNRPLVERLYDEIVVLKSETKRLSEIAEKNVSTNIVFERNIHLNNVHFNYSNGTPVLNNIDIMIEHGSVVGFAGTTGSGKTTLIDIIMGLLEPKIGVLQIDDIPINQCNAKNWRKLVGYVPQDVFLVDDTILSNIAFGIHEKDIDQDHAKKCAQIASIADFIENELQEKYQSKVGERGVRLSGGQRQRIGLARALYRSPEVLVLDEATSALDGATENSIVSNIQNLSSVHTIIIIAHRLNTLKPCKTIYLLEKGRVIDQGDYNTLINSSKRFRELAQIEK